MTPKEIVEKAKKAKRQERKWAPFMIFAGLLFSGVLTYLVYDLNNLFSFFAGLFDINFICQATRDESQKLFNMGIMLTGVFSWLILSVLHAAAELIIKGIFFYVTTFHDQAGIN